jgi:FkbM family methyltransferase
MVRERRLPYRLDRAVNRTAKVLGFGERTITRAGLRFRVRRLSCDEDFVANLIDRREYLQHGLAIQSRDTVIDIGANIGTFSVLAASLGARVIAVEPDAQNMALFRRNITLNGLSSSILPIHAAVADREGDVELHIAEEGGGFHTALADSFSRVFNGTVKVRGLTLADVFASGKVETCDFLKLDCEGAEFAALLAPDAPLSRTRQVSMEYHASPGDVRVTRLIDTLTTAGLRLVFHEEFPHHRGGHLFFGR